MAKNPVRFSPDHELEMREANHDKVMKVHAHFKKRLAAILKLGVSQAEAISRAQKEAMSMFEATPQKSWQETMKEVHDAELKRQQTGA